MNAKVTTGTTDWIAALNGYCNTLSDGWIAMRRHLHQHPELSEAEYQTTEYLLAALDELELPTHVPGEGRGVTADFISSPTIADGKRIAIRGDIDALPIQDAKQLHTVAPAMVQCMPVAMTFTRQSSSARWNC